MTRLLQIAGSLLSLALFAAHPTAFAATTAGSFDPTFGTNGRVVFDYGDNYDYGRQILIQPDGKYLLIGYGSTITPNIGIGFVARHNRDGSYDTTFNATGRRVFGDNSIGYSVSDAALQADGKIVLAGDNLILGTGVPTVQGILFRLNADGSLDSSFGNGGMVQANPTTLEWLVFQAVAVRPDGTLLVLGREYGPSFSQYRSALYRFQANGLPDLTFGTGGRLAIETVAPNFSTLRMQLAADGKVVLAGYTLLAGDAELAAVVRLNADGTADTGFASGGRFTQAVTGYSTEFDDFAFGPGGAITLVGYGYTPAPYLYTAFAVRLSAQGVPDAAFAPNGLLTLPAAVALAQGIALQADGKLVVCGAKRVGDDFQGLILRLQPNGTLDASFGAGGINQDFGYTRSYCNRIALDVDGKIVMAGIASAPRDDAMIARLIGDEITTVVIEFFNSILNHYFITANPAEAAAIDAGAAGPGWSRTTQTFRSGGPTRVCRFYGNPDINPVTGQRYGPNSHVYSIDADECAQIRRDIGWRFESYDFNGWPKTGITSCPAGTIAVMRAYNGRFQLNDSNHRYTTSMPIYNLMTGMGWSGEGVVFCAPA
jgi:uncharacterized delta-60 repeat protein